MKNSESRSRRSFLASLGGLSALDALPAARHPRAGSELSSATRGLARAADYLFAPGLVYLQTGSLGPTPRPVMDRALAAWKELERNPVLYGYGAQEAAMEDVRGQAAAFLGCKKEELVLTRCTTEGMNWVASGLRLGPGDRVLTTDQEHPGGRACWDYAVRRYGAILDIVTIPPGENDSSAIVDRFARALTPRTRAVSFSHVLTSTGLRMPVQALSTLVRERGAIAIVDGAQAAGGIAVDVKGLGCHVYATSGHKWLLGPKGTGLLYLGEDLGDRVDPIALQGGRAAYSDSSGVCNLPGVIGLGAALEYIAAIGIAKIEAHNLRLRNRLYDDLRGMPKLRVVSPPPGPLASPLASYTLPDTVDSKALQLRLQEKHGVVVKVVPRQWLNGNRISTHLFNSERDGEALLDGLKAELA